MVALDVSRTVEGLRVAVLQKKKKNMQKLFYYNSIKGKLQASTNIATIAFKVSDYLFILSRRRRAMFFLCSVLAVAKCPVSVCRTC